MAKRARVQFHAPDQATEAMLLHIIHTQTTTPPPAPASPSLITPNSEDATTKTTTAEPPIQLQRDPSGSSLVTSSSEAHEYASTPNSAITTHETTQNSMQQQERSSPPVSTSGGGVDSSSVIGNGVVPPPAHPVQDRSVLSWAPRVPRPSAAEQKRRVMNGHGTSSARTYAGQPFIPTFPYYPTQLPSVSSIPSAVYDPSSLQHSHAYSRGGQADMSLFHTHPSHHPHHPPLSPWDSSVLNSGIDQTAFPPVTGWAKPKKHHPTTPNEKVPLTCWQRLVRIVISLRFCLLALMVSSLVIVSVLSWRLTFRAAEESLDRVTSDYSSNLITQIATDLDRRLTAAEHHTFLNKEYFRIGDLDYKNDRSGMFRTFLIQVKRLVSDTATSVAFTTKEGESNGYGWYFPIEESPYLTRWDAFGFNFTERVIDPTDESIIRTTVDDHNYTGLNGAWMTIINLEDRNSMGWTTPYLWYGSWFVTNSRSVYSPQDEYLGVVNCDIQLGYVDRIAKDLAAASNVGAQLLLLNAQTGSIIGSSVDTASGNIVGGVEVFLYSSGSSELLVAVHEFLMRNGGSTLEDGTITYSGITAEVAEELQIDSKRVLITVRPFDHGKELNSQYYIDWIIVHMLDRSTIENDIAHSNTNVLIAVICICFGFVLAMSLLLFYSMNLVSSLSHLLTSFARFEFRKHVEDGQLKSRSVFTELKEMQTAVLEMTMAFKSHLEGKREHLGRNRHSHYTMVLDSPATSSTPRLPLPRLSPNDSALDGPAVEVERMAAAALAAAANKAITPVAEHCNEHQLDP